MDDNILKIKRLVVELNMYREAYYNESRPIVTDYQYDTMFDELQKLENETGFIMSNSPTQNVGYPVATGFDKVTHTVPLLSLDKTQDINEFVKFCAKSDVVLMHKLDGLTIKLEYRDGKLYQASTRGDGAEGDDITENAKYFENIPLTVTNKETFKVIGEAIITKDIFEQINKELPDDKKYKNARNLASGTVKNLDTKIVRDRHIKFICWNANDLSDDGLMTTGLNIAHGLGFDIVDNYVPIANLKETVPSTIDILKENANGKFLPIDGIVAVYNNIKYGESLGKTSHHFNNGYAFKFYDEEEETKLMDIEWSMGKTGDLTPVAIFNPVEIDGTTVSRASLHNLSILEKLELGIGDRILVYKANQIIPQIRKNLTKSNSYTIPKVCPICGYETYLCENKTSEGLVKVLKCSNDNCSGKLLGKLCHFVSKEAMNIDGLSEATLNKLISLKILTKITDIYNIKNYRDLLYTLEGFGETSINNLINSIEKSKQTTLDRLINSVSIPEVGKSVAKLLSNYLQDDETKIFELGVQDLTTIEGIGIIMNNIIHKWFSLPNNAEMLKYLLSVCTFKKPIHSTSIKFQGLNFVITGKLIRYNNREALESVILHNAGKVQSSVSSTTDYLINNDINSNSGKNKRAKELNIPIITEMEFLSMLGEDETITRPLTDQAAKNPISTTKNLTDSFGRKKLF